MTQPTTRLLINATTKAAKLLQRDFFELENLQSSLSNTSEFCTNSYSRTLKLLQDNLIRHFKSDIYYDNKPIEINISNDRDSVLLINPIDSLTNLARCLPFFAISITILEKTSKGLIPTHFIMNFPMTSEIYYAEKGNGSRVEKSDYNIAGQIKRLRVSKNSNIASSFISTDNIPTEVFKVTDNSRYFKSPCYDLALLASGKLDANYFSALDYTLKPGFELMITEAGGAVVVNTPSKFIISNYELAEQLKQLVEKNIL